LDTVDTTVAELLSIMLAALARTLLEEATHRCPTRVLCIAAPMGELEPPELYDSRDIGVDGPLG
jgi:hypothetical protein